MSGIVANLNAWRSRFRTPADWLAVAVVVSLPWSTSATGILIGIWLIAVLLALDPADIRRELTALPGLLAVALPLVAIAGMLWADVSLREKLGGFSSVIKLAAIPLLLAQFRTSRHGRYALIGYLVSCAVLLAASYVVFVLANYGIKFRPEVGVPVKNGPTQSGEFVSCVFALLFIAIGMIHERRWALAAGALAMVAGFLINVGFVATSRTALLTILVLLVLLGLRKFSIKGISLLVLAGVLVSVLAWNTSSYLRTRIQDIKVEIDLYRFSNQRSSSGERIEFWRKGVEFTANAPIIGNGTGTIPKLYARAAQDQAGVAAVATVNPHNQILLVSIQWGLVGVLLLFAMWCSHAALFRGSGLMAWIGTIVVVQNIVGSLFNSHLSDFSQGWVYVFGVGIAGGMIRSAAVQQSARAAETDQQPADQRG